jgi:hypothetical protein
MFRCGRSQQPIDHSHIRAFGARQSGKLSPPIGDLLIDVQYPAGKS